MSDSLSTKAIFYDALSSITKRQVSNFHALPISNPNAMFVSKYLGFNKNLLTNKIASQITVTAPFLDSLAHPTAAIAESEKQTAITYKSDQSLYITSGTTCSNHIAIAACCANGEKTLAQKGLHQSIHFSLAEQSNTPDYVEDICVCDQTDATVLDINTMVSMIEAAESTLKPYKVVVINSQSYEGVVHRLEKILKAIASAGPSIVSIIIDEAWGAWSNFDKDLHKHGGISAARKLRKNSKINVIVTHSVHKSLFALRQSSLLHCIGSKKMQNRLLRMRYRHHTTSPNYAIIASLDISRAQMHAEGEQYTARCHSLANLLSKTINKKMSLFKIISRDVNKESRSVYRYDPTKIWIDTSGANLSGEELRNILFEEFGIYACRHTENALMLNVHFGVTEDDVITLIRALSQIEKTTSANRTNNKNKCVEAISDEFIIPYPPGVPLVVPGETITAAVVKKLNTVSESGIPLLHIAAR